ncbi:MAG: Calvin cycle protein CP12 [Hormoscilla sp.]
MTTTPTLEEKIEKERQEARAVCDTKGATSPECAAALDALEEMQAEASHQKEVPPKSGMEIYCDENPDAVECRIYED